MRQVEWFSGRQFIWEFVRRAMVCDMVHTMRTAANLAAEKFIDGGWIRFELYSYSETCCVIWHHGKFGPIVWVSPSWFSKTTSKHVNWLVQATREWRCTIVYTAYPGIGTAPTLNEALVARDRMEELCADAARVGDTCVMAWVPHKHPLPL